MYSLRHNTLFSLNDTVALCWLLSKLKLIVLLAIVVMMFSMTVLFKHRIANYLYELIMVRDNVFTFPGDRHNPYSCNLIGIIANLCTCFVSIITRFINFVHCTYCTSVIKMK